MNQDLIHFRNINTLDEPLFDSPMGTLNIRQVAITGIGCVLIALYALLEVQIGVIPLLIIPIALGMGHRGNMTMDAYLISLLSFKMRGSSTPLIKNTKKTKRSKKRKTVPRAMKIRSKSKTVTKIASKTINRKILVTRLFDTVNISFTYTTIDGEPLKNRLIRVFLDNQMVFEYTTNTLGQMTATFNVNELGKKKLRILAKDIEAPLIEGTLDFVLRDNR